METTHECVLQPLLPPLLHKLIHNFCELWAQRLLAQKLDGAHPKQLHCVGHNHEALICPEGSLFSIIQAAGWPIWPLVACSILALALVIERFLSLQTEKVAPPTLLDAALGGSRTALPPPDVIDQLGSSSALGEVLASGFRAMQLNPRSSEDDLKAAIESAGRVVAHRLERYLSALATIASAAPLMGLFGTVVGMIDIFGSQSPTGGATGGNPALLAHGISVALYNTAFGLIVAIPSLIFWRYFRARVDDYLLTLEVASERLLRHLKALGKL